MDTIWRIIINEIMERMKLSAIPRDEINKIFLDNIRMELWCRSSDRKELSEEVCSKSKDITRKVMDRLLRLRVIKALEGSKCEDKSFDEALHALIEKAVGLYLGMVMYGVRTLDMKVLCKVRKGFYYRNSILTPGYVVLLDIVEAFQYTLAGFVEPLMFI
ncbi:MAG TPA: hypothetical protein EYP48_03060 [Ignisphaera sp.]|uniref:Gins15 C-terminal domain-containing protein n=1 Tax=Ignisphaera aggregans TaxID=334771 RepID=A0A832YSH7_9CREN|nr:hypothetical protein [Ignisphaera sp.]HIP56910.1 hypothetical protein [Ignisphaera aggregans]